MNDFNFKIPQQIEFGVGSLKKPATASLVF